MATVHRTGSVLRCVLCEKFQSYRRDNTRKHLTNVHHLKDALICPLCSTVETDITLHVLNYHIDVNNDNHTITIPELDFMRCQKEAQHVGGTTVLDVDSGGVINVESGSEFHVNHTMVQNVDPTSVIGEINFT